MMHFNVKRHLIAGLALLLSLALPAADASNLIMSHRLAVLGGTRPTLLLETGSWSSSNVNLRTVSVTPPVGTSLLVVYAGAVRRNASAAMVFEHLEFNGSPMTQIGDFTAFNQRIVDGFAYVVSPTTGVAQDVEFTIDPPTAWNGTMIYVWAFSGTHPSDPFGIIDTAENASSQTVESTFTPEYGRPYVLAGSVAASTGGAGSCYSGSNLSVEAQGGDGDDDVAGSAFANATLVGAGATTFSVTCTYPAGSRSLEIVEVKGP